VAPGAPVLIPEESAHPRHNSNDPPVEAGVPVVPDSCLLASTEKTPSQCEDRNREDVMAVTGPGLVVILLIGLPALLCILAIRDLVKVAKHCKTRLGTLQESRPFFVRTEPDRGSYK